MRRWSDFDARHYLAVGAVAVLLIGSGLTAHFSRRDVGITETKIPPETIEYLKGLAGALGDLTFDFKPGTKSDWGNSDDDNQAIDRGLEKQENDYFLVYYHGPDRAKADYTLEKATAAIELMKATFGRYPYPKDTGGRKLPLYVCRDGAEYNRLSGEDASTSRACARIWFYSDGSTLCQGLYFAPGTYDRGRDGAAKTIAHELAHFVYFDRLQATHRYEVPTWFTEGIAEYASGDTEFLQVVRDALRSGGLIPLTRLSAGKERFLVHPIVYGEGLSAFLCVQDHYGKGEVRELVDASYHHGMDGSFQEAIHRRLPEFEQEWLAYVNQTLGR